MEVSYDSIDLESIKSSAKRSWFVFWLNRLIWTNYIGDGAYNNHLTRMSFRGTNYGSLTLGTDSLQMASKQHNAPIFTIPYNSINNSTMNKNDIIIETASEEVGNEDCIC